MNPEQAFQQAVASYGKQDWKTTEALCRQILVCSPSHFDAIHLLGSLTLQSTRFEESRQLLERALKIQPCNAVILSKLGLVCTQLKFDAKALAFFNAALDIVSDAAETYASRGALFESMGQHAPALEDYLKAVELKPDLGTASLRGAKPCRHCAATKRRCNWRRVLPTPFTRAAMLSAT